MQENLYNCDDPALISKIFWSYVKSNSKSQWIPECINLNGWYHSEPIEKAELFNGFFFEQFPGESMIHLFTWLMMLTLIVILVQPKFKFNCQIFTPLKHVVLMRSMGKCWNRVLLLCLTHFHSFSNCLITLCVSLGVESCHFCAHSQKKELGIT